VSPYFETTECPEVILRQADLALYRAKADGRDRVCFHSSDLDEFAKDHDSLISDLRLAVRRNELDVYFQPQVAIATGEIVGMEALARWKHPMRGMISPSVFIPIAEKCHVIAELGHWVLDNACQQIKRWKELGLVPPVVAVNVSALQLRLADEFVLDLQRTLEFWGVAPSALELDIAEPVWAEMAQSGSETIGRLTQLGVGIALDDFGAAGGSMSYLWTNQVQHIKIAPELIEAMLQRPSEAAVVRKIFFLAHLLGIDVIAECVETEAQRAFLLSGMATVNAQGYLYSRAVSPDEAVELIRRHTIAPAGGSQQ
jgi:EAL domain-containing protein (putative c-di-GMP-specific phosphodiesterase class I)